MNKETIFIVLLSAASLSKIKTMFFDEIWRKIKLKNVCQATSFSPEKV